ncbi:methionine-R-sulfoxide reductase B3 isoform X2 [Pseudopipra pipra]|uniref:methionine-R-sulfoxide reductase B3 isoform X2 n=1 Tax=Pseudopipra pipra TaxID=415032 RepID=UPI003139CA92
MGSRRPPRAAGPRRAGGARLPAPCSYLALAAGAQEFPVMLAGRRARHCAPAGGPGPLARSLGPLPMRAAPPPLLPALCLALAAAARAAGSCRDKKDCKVVFSQEELRKRLTPLQYHVTQEKGTESAFEGEYTHHKAQGIYKCVVCGTPLFKSETKFDSNSGWPSFYDVISPDAITFNDDFSYGMHRIEISCSQSDCEPRSSSVISITSFQLSLRSAIDSQGRGSLVKQHDFPVQDKYFSCGRFYFFISCGRL